MKAYQYSGSLLSLIKNVNPLTGPNVLLLLLLLAAVVSCPRKLFIIFP
jgi:hypothetical protein